MEPNVEWLRSEIDAAIESIPGAAQYEKGPRLKDAAGIEAKIAQGRPAETLSDLIGGRILVDDVTAADAALAGLARRFRLLDVEDFLQAPKGGYRAIHAQIDLGNGLSAEIQLVPSAFQTEGAFKRSHDLRDQIKRLHAEQLSEAEFEHYQNTMRAAAAEFDQTWEKIKDRFERRGDVRTLYQECSHAFRDDVARLQGGLKALRPAPLAGITTCVLARPLPFCVRWVLIEAASPCVQQKRPRRCASTRRFRRPCGIGSRYCSQTRSTSFRPVRMER